MRCIRSNRKVDIVNQCGLNPTRNGSYKMRNGYLGTNYNIPSKVGRFSEPLRWSDTHIVIRGDISPIATPAMQQFIEDVSNNTENTKLEYSKHPMMHITYPRRVIKERCFNTKISSIEQNQYYFNKSYLNSPYQNEDNSSFSDFNYREDELKNNFSPNPPSSRSKKSPRNHRTKKEYAQDQSYTLSPRNKNINRLKNRKNNNNNSNEKSFSNYYDPRRKISLYSIIERESTHISKNPEDYIYFAKYSRNNYHRIRENSNNNSLSSDLHESDFNDYDDEDSWNDRSSFAYNGIQECVIDSDGFGNGSSFIHTSENEEKLENFSNEEESNENEEKEEENETKEEENEAKEEENETKEEENETKEEENETKEKENETKEEENETKEEENEVQENKKEEDLINDDESREKESNTYEDESNND